MALELFGGAAIGAVFGEFLHAILEAKQNAEMFRPKLEELEATLEVLHPVIQDIDELNRRLNGSTACETETETIRKLMEDGKKLVSKCCKVRRWDLLKKPRYQQRLTQLDKSLLRFHSLHMQAHMARDVKCSLLALRKVCLTLNVSSENFTLRSSRYLDQSWEIKDVLAAAAMAAARIQAAFRSHSFRRRNMVIVNGYSGDDELTLKRLKDFHWGANIIIRVWRDFNSRISSRNSAVQQYQRSYKNTLRISEYDEMKENESCERSNSTHNTELLALPPPLPSDHETTSGEDHNSNTDNNGLRKHENESQKPPLHILEATAAKLNILSPAVIVLLCCFNLVMTFLIFMFLIFMFKRGEDFV